MIVIYWTWVIRDQNLHGAMTVWDRVLLGNGWIELLLNMNGGRALMLSMLRFRDCSDHHPLLVSFSHHKKTVWQRRRHFRYEASWEKRKNYGAVIQQVWWVRESPEVAWTKVRINLKGCQRMLQRWVREEIPKSRGPN
jgi:hypothetical protein